jgi:hypothetical protein
MALFARSGTCVTLLQQCSRLVPAIFPILQLVELQRREQGEGKTSGATKHRRRRRAAAGYGNRDRAHGDRRRQAKARLAAPASGAARDNYS